MGEGDRQVKEIANKPDDHPSSVPRSHKTENQLLKLAHIQQQTKQAKAGHDVRLKPQHLGGEGRGMAAQASLGYVVRRLG